jgi:hypothetical protein
MTPKNAHIAARARERLNAERAKTGPTQAPDNHSKPENDTHPAHPAQPLIEQPDKDAPHAAERDPLTHQK